jgi:hypothetical protein
MNMKPVMNLRFSVVNAEKSNVEGEAAGLNTDLLHSLRTFLQQEA